MYILEGEYIEYAQDVVYVAESEYGEYAKGDHIRQGGPQWASRQRRSWWSLCQGWQLAEYNNEPLTTIGDWATAFNDREGTKALTIKSIVLNHDPSPLQKPHSACNEVGLSATAITTNA